MKRNNGRIQLKRGETPRHNPKLGFFGFAGLLGFLGIFTYQVNQTVFPFFFFSFFGFFGYYFAGKTACVCKDERYVENLLLAERNAYRIGYALTFTAMIICCFDRPFCTNASKFLFLVISISLIFAAVLFLREYLLYRFDYDASEKE